MTRGTAQGKVILLGEHAVVYGAEGGAPRPEGGSLLVSVRHDACGKTTCDFRTSASQYPVAPRKQHDTC